MNFAENFRQQLLSVTHDNFEHYALKLFDFQAKHNPVYKKYIALLGINPTKITAINQIPFLPITFFKDFKIHTSNWNEQLIFESSGTTGQVRSKHFLEDLNFYHFVAEHIFNHFYGSLQQYHFYALLPAYLENKNSSLVHMVQHFIDHSGSAHSGFYLHDKELLIHNIRRSKKNGRKVFLIGVTFALLDLAEQYMPDLHDSIIMETGGMKGRRDEMIRSEVHEILQKKFSVRSIHSEYGMTELLSQAYAKKNGLFSSVPWMKVYIRDLNDPFHINNDLRHGGINIIDLANVHSCAFIETGDMGVFHKKEQAFEVLGRIDNSDIRGCNLMVF